MVKFEKDITEMPEKELLRHKKMFCAICKEELPKKGEDKAILIRYNKIKVLIPLCEEHYDTTDEELIDSIARITQINGEFYK